MDIEVNTLAQIKAETGRDLDNQVDENTLVSGEKSNGTFGVFKLFAAIKNCIDNWITTIAGNKNFTGAVTINSKSVATNESVNNALANLAETKIIEKTDANDCYSVSEYKSTFVVPVNGAHNPNTSGGFVIDCYTTAKSDQYHRFKQVAYNMAYDQMFFRYGYLIGPTYTWGEWIQFATEFNQSITFDNNTSQNIDISSLPLNNTYIVKIASDNGAAWRYCGILSRTNQYPTLVELDKGIRIEVEIVDRTQIKITNTDTIYSTVMNIRIS